MAFGRGGPPAPAGQSNGPIVLEVSDPKEMMALMGQRANFIIMELGKVGHPLQVDLDEVEAHVNRLVGVFDKFKSLVVPVREELTRRYEEEQRAKAAQAKPN